MARCIRPARIAIAACAVACLAACGAGNSGTAVSASQITASTSTAPASSATPTTVAQRAASIVGALFAPSTEQHNCTGSIIHSDRGDLILTAAHCMSGSPTGWTFVPALEGSKRPFGVWQVTEAFTLPGWQHGQSSNYDIAILKIAKDSTGHTIEQKLGAAALGTAPAVGTTVTAVAYNSDADTAVSCTTKTTKTEGFPTFDCDGFSNGSSGSPWFVADARGGLTVVGLIGGLNQGGCSQSVSYSATFTENVRELASKADQLSQGTSLPQPPSDGC